MIDVEYHDDTATIRIAPAHARPITLVVEKRKVTVGRTSWSSRRTERSRWVVAGRGTTGDDYLSLHAQFETACRSAVYRAKRIEKAYSVPRLRAA